MKNLEIDIETFSSVNLPEVMKQPKKMKEM